MCSEQTVTVQDEDRKKLVRLSKKGYALLKQDKLEQAEAYRKSEDFPQAEEYYTKALTINPQHEPALKGLGYLYYDSKMYREAANYWEQLLAAHKSNFKTITILAMTGDCYRKISDYNQALSFFRRALETAPAHFMSLFGVADSYRGLKQYTEAKRYFNKILIEEPKNQSILTRAGDICVNLGEYDQAEVYYKKALAVGDNIFAHFGFVRIQRFQKNYKQALKLLEEMKQDYPHNQRIQREIAECRENL